MSSTSSTTGPHGSISLRVLIVDDEPATRQLIRLILQGPDLEFFEAEDGEAALTMLRSQEWHDRSTPVDVVISDYNMPRMNGRELLTAMREQFPEVVRIIITADKGVAEAMVRDDLATFLIVKPVDFNEVRACLHAAQLIVQYRQEERRARSS